MKLSFLTNLLGWLGLLALAACQVSTPQIPASTPRAADNDAINTAVARTMSALETLLAIKTSTPTATGTFTPAPPTASPAPTRTPTPGPTPTRTSQPTPTSPPVTATIAAPCNAAQFLADITIPDGTVLSPSQSFKKTWRIRNVGSCAWGSGYALIFDSGELMGGPDSIPLAATIAPGQGVDFSVNLVAPAAEGDFAGYWRLLSSTGERFSTGSQDKPFWVKIHVQAVASTTSLKFTEIFCSAVWKTAAAALACPAASANFTDGSIQKIQNPKLEGGYQDDEPALVMVPPDGADGIITGTYPKMDILSGDHLVTVVGCMDESPKCTVTMKLFYTLDGTTFTELGSWAQVSDSSYQHVDIDLTPLAGKSVQFVLSVQNNDDLSVDDRAFWLNPQIAR